MLFSGFSGLAQLGLFSITGLVVAVAVTRWVLPALLPPRFVAPVVASIGPWVSAVVQRAPVLRYPLLLGVTLVAVMLAAHRGRCGAMTWQASVRYLASDQMLDQQMRRDIGAPDVRFLVVIHAQDEQTALQASEAIGETLRKASLAGLLEGYDSPADYLPSRQAQLARQNALPAAAELRASLGRALQGLPFRPQVFEPFLKDAAAAKRMPLIDRSSLQGTRFALRLDTLLVQRESGWVAMLPLRDVQTLRRFRPGHLRRARRAGRPGISSTSQISSTGPIGERR